MTTPTSLTTEQAAAFQVNNLAAQGLVSQNFDRALSSSNLTLTDGTAYGVLLPVAPNMILTNAVIQIQAAGNGTTHGFVALFSLDGTTRYAVTADTTTPLNSTGTKVIAFATPYTVASGVTALYAVIVSNTNTTVATLLTAAAQQTGAAALSTFYHPVVTGGTGLSALTAPLTFTVSTTVKAPWVGLS